MTNSVGCSHEDLNFTKKNPDPIREVKSQFKKISGNTTTTEDYATLKSH